MKAIGIDLGTTNSVAGYCEPGRTPRVLATRAGENLTPSVVSVRKSRGSNSAPEILVGRAALNYAASAPEDTIFSVKRLMGRDFSDPAVAHARDHFSYRIIKGPGDDPRAYVQFGGETKSPIEISSLILKQIVEDASKALGEQVTHAVITVPAYFTEAQRAATRLAGEEAGLKVRRIIDEPTAAAVTFGLEAKQGDRYRCLVYDFGGGTLDISILQIVVDTEGKRQFHVLVIEGDNWLGGDDFDRKIVEWILDHLRTDFGLDPSSDKRFLLKAKVSAEAAKRALSSSTSADILIPAAFRADDGGLIDVDLRLERSEFESMIQELVGQSMMLVQKAMTDQHLTPELISDVLLVGGSTLTPAVEKAIAAVFGEGKIRHSLNPMECVAAGASILATTMRGVECPKCGALNSEDTTQCAKCEGSLAAARSVADSNVSEPTAQHLGIAAIEGDRRDVFVPIIPKGTQYPLREPMKQRFQARGGRKIVIPVYEGIHPVASRNQEQGVVEFELPKEIDAATPVEVGFNFDRDRVLTVMVSIPALSYLKTETVHRDRPRASAAATAGSNSGEETWQDEMDKLINLLTQFHQTYHDYMENDKDVTIERHLNSARQLQRFPDEREGRRTVQLLRTDLMSCGLATQLFLADHAIEGQPPERTREIREVANRVREAYDQKDDATVVEGTRVLKVLVAKALENRDRTIGDRVFDGILERI